METSLIREMDKQQSVTVPFPSMRRERIRKIFSTNKCGISSFTCKVKSKDTGDEIYLTIEDCDPVFSTSIVFKPKLLRIFNRKDMVIVCLKKNHEETFKKLADTTTKDEIKFHQLCSSHGMKFVIEIELDKITELRYKRLKR